MARPTAYAVLRDTLAAEPGREFHLVHLQNETGYSAHHVYRTLQRLEGDGRLLRYGLGSESRYTYRAPRASAGRVPYQREGRCLGCNKFNHDGTVTKITAGQCSIRLCDLCMKDAGLKGE
jgi:hypothetical protein